MFVDFRSAFDHLWHQGCIGKLRRAGIPPSYLRWIEAWLSGRRGYIELKGRKSRWFPIKKGGPQGGVLTPTLFITYHNDMSQFLSSCSSHFFADDLAATMSGRLGAKYSDQCLDLERRIKLFIDQLEFYAILSAQPVNFSKTEAMFSARAVIPPKFDIHYDREKNNWLDWTPEFKYLGYLISPKLGWNKLIHKTKTKVRQCLSLISSLKLAGCSSPYLKRTLFTSYILPLFTWLFPLFPLFTSRQRDDLNRFYLSSIRRLLSALHWNNQLFTFITEDEPLDTLCRGYWENYLLHLSNSIDGKLLLEQATLNQHRESWLAGEYPIQCLRRSKRLTHKTIIEAALEWMMSVPCSSSVPFYQLEEILALVNHPDTFV